MSHRKDILRVLGLTASVLLIASIIVIGIWRFASPTVLMGATYNGDDNQVRWLLSLGADPNAREETYTALDYAAVGCSAQTMKLMIKKGASVNQKNGHGWTPLHFTAVHNHVDIADVLVGSGADINARDDNGETAIIVAADRGRAEMVRFLLYKNADATGVLESARGKNKGRIIQLLTQRQANRQAR